MTDGTDSVDEAITITVNNVNRAPVLGAIGDKSVDEGGSLSFTVSATDADESELKLSVSGLPDGASFDAGLVLLEPGLLRRGHVRGHVLGGRRGGLRLGDDHDHGQ